MDNEDIKKIKKHAHGIRLRVLEHTLNSKEGGYLCQACSSAEILSALYMHLMHLGPSEGEMIPRPFGRYDVPSANIKQYRHGSIYNGPKSPQYDRFFLSPTHYALCLYAVLIEDGRLDEHGLDHFNKDGSSIEMIGGEHSPGIEMNGGSFGQTLPHAAGVAVARKLKKESGHVWVFLSDGELQEGQTWEAFLTMAFHKIDNITVFIDVNNQQVDGRMENVMGIEPLYEKIKAFNAEVVKVDGHNPEELVKATTVERKDKPLVILGYTNPMQGIEPLQERYPYLHHIRFRTPEERERYRQYLEKIKKIEVTV